MAPLGGGRFFVAKRAESICGMIVDRLITCVVCNFVLGGGCSPLVAEVGGIAAACQIQANSKTDDGSQKDL